MVQHNSSSLSNQVESLRRQFVQASGLPFGDVLNVELVQEALHAEQVSGHDHIYTPLVTVRMAAWHGQNDRRFVGGLVHRAGRPHS
jgi:hypothetical protein